MIKTEPTYTEYEISRILRQSEGHRVAEEDEGQGHAEHRHELQSRGADRKSTTMEDVQLRIVGLDIFDKKARLRPRSSAFNGTQAAAIAFALNKKAGQTALSFLCRDTCEFVNVDIDIEAGGFSMIGYNISELEPAPSGARFVVGPKGLIMPGILKETRVAKGIWMKLMKTEDRSLHIRTAYPLTIAPNPQKAEVHWHHGGIHQQVLPI